MSTTAKTPRTSSSNRAPDAVAQQTQAVGDATRQQLAMAVDQMAAMYRAAEAMQLIQHQLTQRMALRHQQMAEKLRNADTPADFLSLQSVLLTSGLQEAVQYWQELGSSTMKMQGEMMNRATATASEAASNAEPAALQTNPMIQAWQTLFLSPLNGLAAATRH